MQKSNPTRIDHPKPLKDGSNPTGIDLPIPQGCSFLFLLRKGARPLKEGSKGIALIMVLAFILVVVVLANIVLVFIASQARFTHHRVSRIQAYYAAQAGMNYALEQLRTAAWGAGSYTLCRSGCDVNDVDISFPVNIVIGAPGGVSGTRRIDVTATYTYMP